ncbi:MAG: radical SAM family heme chaperone HemW [Planctomycetes bacterium]|nr:radical SAM family heme chaperone HemW [Planctomycetota bacterium]
MKNLNPSLYIHIPFCLRRCSYCAFSSRAYSEREAGWYLAALDDEMAPFYEDLAPPTIYLGGGTPTALPLWQFEQLLGMLLNVNRDTVDEFTMEANPGTLSMDKLKRMRRIGVNRVSIGVQSFSDEGLSVLGRIHNAKQAQGAVAIAGEAGFDNISIDLIFGWPGQTLEMWESDLKKALQLGVPHISCYGLTYESGTSITSLVDSGALERVSEDLEREMFDLTAEMLGAGGLPRYEISNFSVPGFECRHNINYWKGGEYVGFGASAHSCLADTRYANVDDCESYVRMLTDEGDARIFEETLDPERRARECAVIWLRLAEGIKADEFREHTGYPLEELFVSELPGLTGQGLLEWTDGGGYLRLSDEAIPLADSVLSELVL